MTVAHATSRPGVVSLAGGAVTFGTRLPYAAHRVVTPAEADALTEWRGLLITGPVSLNGRTATDCIIEARARTNYLVDQSGGGTLRHVSGTGLEADANGDPAVLHPVKQGLSGSGFTIENCDIAWVNDGWNNAHHANIKNSRIRDHQYFCAWDPRNKNGPRYVVQHRDGIQPYGKGALVVDGVEFYNDAAPWPLNAKGERVPVSWNKGDAAGDNAQGPAGASASIMFNSASPYTEIVTVKNTRSWGGVSVTFNGLYGSLVDAAGAGENSMLDMHDNIVEDRAKAVISGDVRYARYMWVSWTATPAVLRPGRVEPWRVRLPDGTTRGAIRADFVY